MLILAVNVDPVLLHERERAARALLFQELETEESEEESSDRRERTLGISV